MNLKACRQRIRPQELFAFVRAHEKELMFPDQDVLNMCYGDHVLQVEDALWNYDARNYSSYMRRQTRSAMGDDTYRHLAFLRPCQAVASGLSLSFWHAVSALYAAERKIERQAVMRAAFFHRLRKV